MSFDNTGHELQSAQEIQKIASGFREARILLSAIDLGIFTALADSKLTSTRVAEKIGTDPGATDRLMNSLCVLGLLVKHGEDFENTPAASTYLREDSDRYMAGLAHTSHTYHSWGTLTDAVRSGGRVHNKTPMDDPEWTEAFIAAMHNRARGQAGELAGLADLSGTKRLLDVGGGSGVFSMAFCRAEPELTAVVFDLPSVTPLTRKYIDEAGYSHRISTVSGDYRSDEFGRDFDIVLFSAIMHINSPDMNRDILKKAADALNPGGQILISDFFVEPGRCAPSNAVIFAINMLVNTDAGDTYTVQEMTDWLEDAGCQSMEYKETGVGHGLLTGRIL
jgi:predicted O-methyltransferase YrrM